MTLKYKTMAMACAVILSSTMAVHADNKITFTGKVLDSGCTISVNDGTSTLDLGTIAATDIPAKGQTGAPKAFNIKLAGCPAVAEGVPTKVFVKFSGNTEGDTSYFKNDLSGADAATNTGVLIKDSNGSPVVSDSDNAAIPLPAAGGDINMVYTASLVATAALPGQGDVSSAVTYNVTYQ